MVNVMQKKRTAVVKGVGAEEGVGAAVRRRFAVQGHHVAAAVRTTAKLSQVGRAITLSRMS